MAKEPVYVVTYNINGQPDRPVLKRGNRTELQAILSDALHYDLDSLSVVKENTLVDEILELLEPSWGAKQPIEVKQAPINTANHSCKFCGKSIRYVEEDNSSWWVHQHSSLSGCWDDTDNYAIPAQGQ